MSKALIAVDKSRSFRVYLTITTDLVAEAARIHDTTPLGSAGLGRVLTAAGLMGIMMKNPTDKLTVSFKGEGPARQILATGYGTGKVKGYIANPYVDLPLTEAGKLDVGGSLGLGDLTVIKDIGLKEPYMGTIALVSGEIADDLTAYFYISEQQNSSVALGVKVEPDLSIGAAGGMIIQMMPEDGGGVAKADAPAADGDGLISIREGAIQALEKVIADMPPMTTLIDEIAKNNKAASESGLVKLLLEKIFEELPEEYKPEVLEERDIEWECDCSRERIEQALMTIGRKDLTEIIEEEGQAELQCQFCLRKYQFNKEELEGILELI
ncbi:MAG: Hsp33 family molecular chaperone HslO [Clostridia bacterium]|nr:Hsp33 family molecular chaperone HslO [Clostridia bacterium]